MKLTSALAICIATGLTSLGSAQQITCDGTLTNGDSGSGGAGLMVPADMTCFLDGGTVKGSIFLSENAKLIADGINVQREIICGKCQEVNIVNSNIAGLTISNPASGGLLNLSNLISSGGVAVSSGPEFSVSLTNTCGAAPGDMDVTIEQVQSSNIIEIIPGPECIDSGVGDLKLTNNNADFHIGSRASTTLLINSDVSFVEITGDVRLSNLQFQGDLAFSNIVGGLSVVSTDFGNEDIKIEGITGGVMVEDLENTGSFSFSNIAFGVNFECTERTSFESALFESISGDVVIAGDCDFGSLECKETGNVLLDNQVDCEVDRCDNANMSCSRI